MKILKTLGKAVFWLCIAFQAMQAIAAPGNPANPLNRKEFCWIDSYGRGAGTIPNACPVGSNNTAGICYQPCASGAKNVAGVCWDSCRDGFADTGTGCQNKESISYTPKLPCTKRTPKWAGHTCVMWGAPDCRDGYKAAAGVCWNKETSYYIKGTKPQSTSLPNCASSKQKDAGLCYDACRAGSKGVGPVCWGTCSGERNYPCGAGCAMDQGTCSRIMAKQVVNTAIAAGNIAAIVYSGGATVGGMEELNAIRTKANIAVRILDWREFQTTALYALMQKVYRGVATEYEFEQIGWPAGKNPGVNQSEKAYYQKMDALSDPAVSEEKKLEIYLETFALAAAAMLDPTGLVYAGETYLYGVCSKVGTYP
jgi:hypothetical protein